MGPSGLTQPLSQGVTLATLDSNPRILPPEMMTIESDRVFVPLTTGVIPCAGIVAHSNGRPSVVLSITAVTYGRFRRGLYMKKDDGFPVATHAADTVLGPETLPVVIGQLLACAQVAGWDMGKLAEDLNRAEGDAGAAFADADPLTFGIRIQ